MIIWPAVLGLAYIGALVTGLILSITIRGKRHVRSIRIATGVLATPILFFAALFAVLRFTILKEPPTLPRLQRDFATKRAVLETIVHMSDQDVGFSRIAPNFLDRNSDRFTSSDSDAGLNEARWDAYRAAFASAGVKLGIQRDGSGDAFIMVASVGLLNRGHTSEYLYAVRQIALDRIASIRAYWANSRATAKMTPEHAMKRIRF